MSDSDIQDGVPSWLNQEFLEKVLGDVRVTSSEVVRATAPGDNYMSVIYRARVHYTRAGLQHSTSLIVKVEPNIESMKQFIEDYEMFETEVIALKEVLPAMHKLLEEVLPGEFTPFSAKLLYSHYGRPATVVVLEDLAGLGFEMAERMSGLDRDHCLLIMNKLAQFHAASAAIYRTNPELLQPFMNPASLKMADSGFKESFSATLQTLAENLETGPQELKRFSGKIGALSEDAMDRWVNGRIRDEEEFNVLNHGDLWVNNVMFRYSKDRKPVDVRFVDYQLTYWTSPGIDLQYFLNSSPATEIMKEQNVLIDECHKALGDTLRLLGYKHLHPTSEEMETLMNRRGTFGVICVFSIRNAVLADRDNVPDLDKMLKENASFPFGRTYLDSLKLQLPLLEDKGWF